MGTQRSYLLADVMNRGSLLFAERAIMPGSFARVQSVHRAVWVASRAVRRLKRVEPLPQ
jgi:hypothetical protein